MNSNNTLWKALSAAVIAVFFAACASTSKASPPPVDYSAIGPNQSAIIIYTDNRIKSSSPSALSNLKYFTVIVNDGQFTSPLLTNYEPPRSVAGMTANTYNQSCQMSLPNGPHQLKVSLTAGPNRIDSVPINVDLDNVIITYRIRLATSADKKEGQVGQGNEAYILEEVDQIWKGERNSLASNYSSSIAVRGQDGANVGVQGAVNRTCRTLLNDLPQGKIIAVLNCATDDTDTAAFIMEGIEYHLVNSKQFVLVDRKRLDEIRAEQNFQMSGDVDDNTAVSIGHMTGAQIVLTGSISKAGNYRNLIIKALDVETGRILSMTREEL